MAQAQENVSIINPTYKPLIVLVAFPNGETVVSEHQDCLNQETVSDMRVVTQTSGSRLVETTNWNNLDVLNNRMQWWHLEFVEVKCTFSNSNHAAEY